MISSLFLKGEKMRRQKVFFYVVDMKTNELEFRGRGFYEYEEALSAMLVMQEAHPEKSLEIIEGIYEPDYC